MRSREIQEQPMTNSPHSAHGRKMRLRPSVPELSLLVGIVAMALYPTVSHCQSPAATPAATAGPATPVSASAPAFPAQATGTPITLDEAIRRAQISDVNYRTAAASKS